VRRGGPGRGGWVGAVAAGLAAVVVVIGSGCIGTTDRAEFNETIRQRGGGLTSELPGDAVAAVAADLDVAVDDVGVRTVTVTPLDATVVLEVRDPAVPGNLDRYVVRRGAVDEVAPIRLAASDGLDAQTFPVAGLALDEVESMVDAALAEFGPGGFVSSLSAGRTGPGDGVVIQLALESPRAAATARFTPGGELLEVTRT
jgi:hypothetical protein